MVVPLSFIIIIFYILKQTMQVIKVLVLIPSIIKLEGPKPKNKICSEIKTKKREDKKLKFKNLDLLPVFLPPFSLKFP